MSLPALNRSQQVEQLAKEWAESPRWKNVKRGYDPADVVNLRGSAQSEQTLAIRGAEKL